ncbi:hypothetical protein EGW08_013428 [Elysia chlorotica]|uniref:Uncharacterized protein n=1 Tax=Elysia chlorotica TaxID=188477 RepID=A0A433TBB6_ELYCH|nr:hypothetical protein EGW08_013428 [Elysia chlorotica]
MTENQSPWLSTKHPPKQTVNGKRQRMSKGPLSRKTPPLQMISSPSSIARLTQNSPPPVQLKLARKQSSLLEYFGSAGKNGDSPSSVPAQRKRKLEIDDPDVIQIKTECFKDSHHGQSAGNSCCDASLKTWHRPLYPLKSLEPVTSTCGTVTHPDGCEESMDSLIQGDSCYKYETSSSNRPHNKTSPLKEIQVACLPEPSVTCLRSPEKPLDTDIGKHSSNFSPSESSCVRNLVSSESSRIFTEQSGSVSSESTSLSKVLAQKQSVATQDDFSDNLECIESISDMKNSFSKHTSKNESEKIIYEDDKFSVESFTLNVSDSVEIESSNEGKLLVNCEDNDAGIREKEGSKEQDINFDSQNSEMTSPSRSPNCAWSIPSVQGDLNVSSDSCLLSFTEDSQSLHFTETVAEGINSTSCTADQIYGDAMNRLDILKAQHMAEMGTLTFTQTQNFSL